MEKETLFLIKAVDEMKALPDGEDELVFAYNKAVREIPKELRKKHPEIRYRIFKEIVALKKKETDISQLLPEEMK